MGKYQVRAPDGHTYEFEAPDDASPEQLDAMSREVSGYAKNYPVKDKRSGLGLSDLILGKEVDPAVAELKALRDKGGGKAGLSDLLLQGAMFGLGDETAGVANVIDNAVKAPFSDSILDPVRSYQIGNEAEDMRLDEARQSGGIPGTIAEIGGGFLGGNPAAGLRGAATLGGRMMQGVRAGAVGGGVGGFGYGEGLGGTALSTLLGMGLGSAAGAAFPLVGEVFANRAAGLSRLLGRDPHLPRRIVAETIQADGNTPRAVGQMMQDAQGRGSPMMLADTGENARALAASVSRQPGPARTQTRQAVAERQEGQADRITGAIQRDLGPTSNPHEVRAQLEERARTTARPLYEAFESAPGASSVRLDDLQNRPAFKQALRKAYDLAAERGEDPHSLGFDLDQAGEVVLTENPSWKTLNLVKQGMDDVVYAKKNPLTGRAERTNETGAVNATLQTLISRMDAINPHYAPARAAWGGPVAASEAMDKGLKALTKTADDITAQTARMAPYELDLYRLGVRRAMAELVSSKGDYANKVHALMGSPKKRQALSRLFQDSGDLGNFGASLGDEQAAQETYQSVMGGSQTAERTAQDATTNDTGLAETAMDAALRGGKDGMWSAVVAALQKLREVDRFGAGEAGNRTRESIAALLTETDPAVLRELIRAAARANARQRVGIQSRGRRAVRVGEDSGRLIGSGIGSTTEQRVPSE